LAAAVIALQTRQLAIVERLTAQAEAIDPGRLQDIQPRRIDIGRIGLDRKLVARSQRKPAAR